MPSPVESWNGEVDLFRLGVQSEYLRARVTTLIVETSEGVELRLDIAGAGSRFSAGLLDALLLALGFLILISGVALASAIDPAGVSGFLRGLLVGGAILLVIGYHVAFHLLGNGQTPGKRANGIRVVGADGQPATALQILVRGLIQPIDVLLFVPASIGLMLIAATPRHQRLGDLAVGTMVVRVRTSQRVNNPFPGESWSGLFVRTLPLTPGLVARLTPDDRALLRALVTREGLIDDNRRALFVETARTFAAKLELGPFEDARVVLKELYLYLREQAQTNDRVPA